MNFSAPIILLAALLGLSACVHKVSIQQGNFLDDEAIERVETGMTRDQVKLLLGTPMADDPFIRDRWDYVYYFRNGVTGDVVTKRLVVYFEGDRVARLERRDG